LFRLHLESVSEEPPGGEIPPHCWKQVVQFIARSGHILLGGLFCSNVINIRVAYYFTGTQTFTIPTAAPLGAATISVSASWPPAPGGVCTITSELTGASTSFPAQLYGDGCYHYGGSLSDNKTKNPAPPCGIGPDSNLYTAYQFGSITMRVDT
jgi:hypothetical protein